MDGLGSNSVANGFEDICDFRKVMAELEIAEPRPRAVPHLWSWSSLRDRLLSAESFDLSEVHRRAFALCNPGLGGRPHAATTLFAAVSVYYPGDNAPVHRHTASASRFALEGTGGYTVVGGEKLVMRRGDLVITPNGEWHDHGNDGTEPVMWVDVLDVPLLETMNAIMTEWTYTDESGAPAKKQPTRHPPGHSTKLFGGPGIVPLTGWEARAGRRFTPKYMYDAQEVRTTQERLRGESGSPYDGVIVEYVDPTSGRSVVPTLSFRSQLLRPGEQTRPQRRTADTVFCVLEGSGITLAGDQTMEWSRNDLFVVPGWTWFDFKNASAAADAVLYSVSDIPAVQALGCYRAQGREADGSIVDLSRWPDFA